MSPRPPVEQPTSLVRPYRRLRAAAEEPAHGVTDADIRAIFRTLVKQAVAGNQEAARAVLDRVLGRPVESEVPTPAGGRRGPPEGSGPKGGPDVPPAVERRPEATHGPAAAGVYMP
jgi:hypothetical protein